jgi:3-oxocholest-4-en-26-oate---CoA ligase
VTRSFNLADLYEIVVEAAGDRLALVAGDARLTYRQLDDRANQLAHALRARGLARGEHVAVYATNCAEWIETMLACYKLGAVPINVNFRYVRDELAYVLSNADCVAVVLQPEFEATLADVRAGLPKLRFTLSLGADYEAALAEQPATRLEEPRSSDDSYVLYTGGTTGLPKGVVWRHEDIFFAALGGGGFGLNPIETPGELAARVMPPDACMIPLVTAPLMHGGGQWMSFITFFGGGKVVLYTGKHFDPDEVWRLVERERANTVMVVGDAMARPLAEALARNPRDASSVAVIGSGGAILSKAVRSQLAAVLPNAVPWDNFGASETGAGGSFAGMGDRGPKFASNERVTVLGDDMAPVAPGETGRLARRGHIPIGYYNDPAKTAATFLIDPNGERWSVPGDAAILHADGTIELLGRGTMCINTGGEKVFPEEVEAVLKAHPAVFDAVVVGVPDERFVERVAAIVQPRPDEKPALEELQAHCRQRLAGYKVPRQVTLVEQITRTPVGKPDYRWAREVATRG